MYFRLLSDLHLEFGPFTIPAQDTDKETILLLAGDIALSDKPNQYKDFILDAVDRFAHVIWICGNHEHYGTSMVRSIAKMKRNCGDHPNLHIIQNETVIIDDVAFIGTTMWSDMSNQNPLMMMAAESQMGGMTDYRVIRIGPKDMPYKRRIRAEDTVREHTAAVKYITKALEEQKEAGRKTVVMTHHGPSWQSICEQFKGDQMNPAYVTPLDDLILEYQPAYWVHGHVHCVHDYNIGDTNILVNPRGYEGSEHVEGFDPCLTIEL